MSKDDDVKPQNKSSNDEPIIPIPPISPFEPMPVIPIHLPQPDSDEFSAE
ncbi:MAG: hypothetical protein ACERKZ_19445 [Lachnotalea sp.]